MNLNSIIQENHKQIRLCRQTERSDPSFLPIHLSGGMGDVIMSIGAIKQLEKHFQLALYTGYPGVFKRFSGISAFKDMPDFTWHLEFNTVARFRFHDGFHGFLLKEHEDLYLGQRARFKESPYLHELVKQHPNKDFLLCRYAATCGLDRRSFPLYSLGL